MSFQVIWRGKWARYKAKYSASSANFLGIKLRFVQELQILGYRVVRINCLIFVECSQNSSPKKMQLLALVTTFLAIENVPMHDQPVRTEAYVSRLDYFGLIAAVPFPSSEPSNSCVSASDIFCCMFDCKSGSFDVKSTLKTREWPELLALGSFFNS